MFGLDFETYSSVDLRKHGLDRYINSADFRVCLASIAFSNGRQETFDFVRTNDPTAVKLDFEHRITYGNRDLIVAHNAPFERAVLRRMGLSVPDRRLIDSAAAARMVGAASKLEAAGPQLTGHQKMEEGRELIRLFAMPQKDGTIHIDEWQTWDQDMLAKWQLYQQYCERDAFVGLSIIEQHAGTYEMDREYELVTQRMNDVGWHVDMDVVKAMQEQYFVNLADLEEAFRVKYDPNGELNFRSPIQLAKWCRERNVRVTSLDEQHLARYLKQVGAEMQRRREGGKPRGKASDQDLSEVLAMLVTKKELGGSSLSKLQTIIDMTGSDGRLRNQYLHAGAGQSYRTSGRGVQMQNLKRLGPEPDDVTDVLLEGSDWDNDMLARNLRQVFTAAHAAGQLIVGDFSAVESRGLAYLAGEEWKLQAYRQGQDLYKVLASSMINVPYERIDKAQRQQGKVGELSCGYGAGAGAVSRFAQKMGMDLDETQAGEVVVAWREANPNVVQLWKNLDQLLHLVVEEGRREASVSLRDGSLRVMLQRTLTPDSLLLQSPRAATVQMKVLRKTSSGMWVPVLTRTFQGCFMDGNDVCYHKPSELKSGKLWRDTWEKNGERGRYKLYGGKLTGILTQSFCRELFFDALERVDHWTRNTPNVQLIGQFHDEIVLEWSPITTAEDIPLGSAITRLEKEMSDAGPFFDFPLVADVKHDYRYTK